LGGLSLVVWVHHSGVYVIRYPIDGFEKGKSIKPEQAGKLHEETLEWIRSEMVRPQVESRSCVWTLDASENGDVWGTGCGAYWWFETDGPFENGVQYCFKCGGVVELNVPEEEEEE
jgi:hypothetical protein